MGREIRKRLEKTCSDLTRKQKAPHPWGFLFKCWFVDLDIIVKTFNKNFILKTV